MNSYIWRLVREGYRNSNCSAYVAGQPGESFIPQRWVHQGTPLSMKLCQVYLNDLLQQPRESIFGVRLDAIDGTCPSFADDTTLVYLYNYAMNKLLELDFHHKTKWGYEFNTDTTIAMIWRKDTSPNMNILLGNDEKGVVTSFKHVAVGLVSKSADSFNAFQDRVAVGRRIVYSARGIGSERVPVSPLVMSKLYWSVVIPNITYGLEVTPLTEQGIQLMERSHRQTCWLIQGLPQNTPTPDPIATVG